MLGVHTDITARKTAETHLRQTEHLFQTIVNSIEEGVIVYDIDLRYQLWNRFMEILTDMPATEVIGKQATELFPHLQEQGIVNLLERALAGETILSNDTPYRIPHTNKTGWVMGMYSPLITPNGDIIGVVGTIRDITGRKQAEDALRQTQKMESLGILAGGIAHDFNNLLVAMLGQTSLAFAKLPENHPAQSHIKKASQAAERAADLTQQMLAYSGRGHFEKQPINLNQLIQENLHLMAVAVPKQVYLRSNLAPSLPLISGDVGQIQQVLMNLILNGAEAIGATNGVVTIVTSTEEVTADDDRIWRYDHDNLKPGLYVTLEIYDTGGGMDETVLPRIFDPFFTTKTTGRGLGLAAVQGIVRGHEGGLRVYSEPGKGSTFKILLPASSEANPIIRTNETLKPAEKQSGLILVIDDEEPVREAVTDILALQGLEVISAANGQAGIDLYQQHKADILLVLLDLSMPGMSGEETFRHLRHLNPHITVILSSGYNEVEATSHFVGKGLAGFIQKPYNMATLTNKVMSYLSTNKG
jgi:PAS domain S-box-containing protein